MSHNLSAIASLLLLAGCAVTPYPDYGVVRPASASNRVLVPAPENVRQYSEATAEAWDRTFNECVQTRDNIKYEIAGRQSRRDGWRWLFTILSATSGLATVIYSGLEDSAKKEVIIPLGALSSTAAVTLQNATTADRRLDSLSTRVPQMDAAHRAATRSLMAIEALIGEDADATEVERAIADLQARLLEWQLLCQ